MESIWMIVGYQVGTHTSFITVTNTIALFFCSQLGRQLMMFLMFSIYPSIDKPLKRFYARTIEPNRYFQWFIRRLKRERLLNEETFLTLVPSSWGMLTPLNGPIKLLLIVRRKLRVLSLATLISSAIFDCIYLLLGAVFHTTQLHLTYLPIFLLLAFAIVAIIRNRLYRRYKNKPG